MAIANLISQESTLVGTVVNAELTTTGLTVAVQFKDSKTGAAREPQATTLDFVFDKDTSRWEHIKADSHTTAAGITTITINAAGRNMPRFGTGAGSGTGFRHPVGSQVGEVYTHRATEQINKVLDGTNATSGTAFRVGDETDSDMRYYAQNADGNKPYVGYDAGTNQWVFTNDGISENPLTGSAALNAGDGIDITAGTISVDGGIQITTNDTNANYLDSKLTVSGAHITKTVVNPGADETINLEVDIDSTPVDTDYTAAETIAAGAPVSTSGTDEVENFIVSTLSDAGTESTFDSGLISSVRACNIGDNKVAAIWIDSASDVQVIAGTVAADKTITWGTPVELTATGGAVVSITRIEDDKFAVVYRDSSDSNIYAVICTVSGTTITNGVASSVHTNVTGLERKAAITLVDTDKLVVAYADNADSNKGKAKAATFTGTTIGTWGSAVEFEAGATNNLAIAKFDTDKAGVFYEDDDDGDKGKGALLVATGTSLAANTPVEFNANATDLITCAQVTTDKIVVCYDPLPTDVEARIASLSGLTISYGAEVDVDTSGSPARTDVCVIDSGTAIISYENAGTSLGKFNELSISGTTITVGTQYTFNGGTNTVNYVGSAKLSDKDKFIILYRDQADGDKGNAEVYQNYDNSAAIVGFAQSTVAVTDTVTVRSKGLDANQAGLTAGTTYYCKTGGVEATNNTGILAGVAKDTDELDIDIDTDIGMSKADADTLTDGSDAVGLHVHSDLALKAKSGVTSRNMTTATGTQTIAHGLGAIPKLVKFEAVLGSTYKCFGSYDGNNSLIATYFSGQGSPGAWCLYMETAGGQVQYATCTTDATNITLSWIKVNAPTGILSIQWTAFS